MKPNSQTTLKDGLHCEVIAGTHGGKSGRIGDTNTSKTGHVTITVDAKRWRDSKTLATNVIATTDA